MAGSGSTGSAFVSFLCQSCNQPIKQLEPSLLDGTYFETLVAPLTGTASRVSDGASPSIGSSSEEARVPTGKQAPRREDGLSSSDTEDGPPPAHMESFIVLSRSSTFPSSGKAPRGEQSSNLSHRLRVATKLFDLMNSRSDFDHPLCQDCADLLLERLDRRLADVTMEQETFAAFLKELESGAPPQGDGVVARTEEETAALKRKETAARASLADLSVKCESLRKEAEDLRREAEEIARAEAELCAERNLLQEQERSFAMERDSLSIKIEHASRLLDKLQKTNVYNDAFRIWHDGQFGTINGFRLGRLPGQPVDWSEINAALGQTLLLLYTVAKKLGFKFKSFKLVPNGSFSRIERIDGDKAVYEFYNSDSISLNKLFLNRRFDIALVAFLNCIQQLAESLEADDSNFKLPYRIAKDKIGDASIRLQFNQDETWTRALKYLLIDVKWILAFVSGRHT
ncbi:autophagy protein Apg6-domain-containing protein [Hyaloraphidium curvatum]|nr:autophagy protein Apg6-domain-containing protein [Hyaloraphidium curvatum]